MVYQVKIFSEIIWKKSGFDFVERKPIFLIYINVLTESVHIQRHAYVACTSCHIARWFVVGSSGLTTSATHVYCHLTTRQHTIRTKHTNNKNNNNNRGSGTKIVLWFSYALISKLLLLMKHRALCSCDIIISFSVLLLHVHWYCLLMHIFCIPYAHQMSDSQNHDTFRSNHRFSIGFVFFDFNIRDFI